MLTSKLSLLATSEEGRGIVEITEIYIVVFNFVSEVLFIKKVAKGFEVTVGLNNRI